MGAVAAHVLQAVKVQRACPRRHSEGVGGRFIVALDPGFLGILQTSGAFGISSSQYLNRSTSLWSSLGDVRELLLGAAGFRLLEIHVC